MFWSAGDWFCQQHLFPWSSFSFGSVWLVRRRYISPGLSLARGRERERASILHLRISAHLVPFVIALLFFLSLVLSLGANSNDKFVSLDHVISRSWYDMFVHSCTGVKGLRKGWVTVGGEKGCDARV